MKSRHLSKIANDLLDFLFQMRDVWSWDGCHTNAIPAATKESDAGARLDASDQITVPATIPVVLMVSGGSDSTAMCLGAYEINRYFQELMSKPAENSLQIKFDFNVLHVNHNLRGQDSDGDELFVKELAKLCRFSFVSKSIDIKKLAKDFDGNIENAARHFRYKFAFELLNELCTNHKVHEEVGQIWTAHTANDRAETFFMRAIVGSGPAGLSSIQAINGNVMRPLLSNTRDELRDYVKSRMDELGWHICVGSAGSFKDKEQCDADPAQDSSESKNVQAKCTQYWREDHTNYEDDGFRAFVRNSLIPLAQTRNPALIQTLNRTMDLISDENSFFEREVKKLYSAAVNCKSEGEIVVELNQLDNIELVIARRLAHQICKDALSDIERATFGHIEHLTMMLLGQASVGDSFDLPGNKHVHLEHGRVIIDTKAASDPNASDPAKNDFAANDPNASNSATSDPAKNDFAASDPAASDPATNSSKESTQSSNWEYCLDVPGELDIPEVGLRLSAQIVEFVSDKRCAASDESDLTQNPIDYVKQCANKDVAFFDLDKIARAISLDTNSETDSQLYLNITNRQPGDYLHPLGMNGHTKLISDVLIDKKVPKSMRDELAVVKVGGHIVWLVGILSDECFRVEKSTMNMLVLKID